MPRRAFLVPGANKLVPLRQGDLSNLCGVYSLVNGLQLALFPVRPLRRREMADLLQFAFSSLAGTSPVAGVVAKGMSDATWMRLCNVLVKYVAAEYDLPITASRELRALARTDWGMALRRIKCAIRAGSPVLVGLFGALDHYSVIAGYTDTRLRLFDSSGHKWVGTKRCGFAHGGAQPRHRILKRSVTILRLA